MKEQQNNSKQNLKDRNVIIKDREGFTQVSNRMLSDQNISYKAKGILCHLLSHDQDRFKISTDTLIKHGADGSKSIQAGILELKKNGYLRIIREAGNKGAWTYVLNMFGNKFTDIPKIGESPKSDISVLGICNNKNNNNKKNNETVKNENVCEEKKEKTVQLNNIEGEKIKAEPEKDQHTPSINFNENSINSKETYSTIDQDTSKTSLNRSGEVLNGGDMVSIGKVFPDSLKIENIDNSEIDKKYDLQIKEVTNKYNHLMEQIPKLTTSELIGNSEKLMSNLGIGFDDNPRRILNKIYNSLPNDHSIMEDSKDIELVQEIIGKYKSSNPETRSAISKRLYQALELMVKIYYIKKYGEEYRGKLYPEIIDKNLVLYLNCNPTLKYCYSGFSNDIDGVFEEVKRLINKKNQKIIDEIENEKQKELSRLEAYRKDAIHSAIPEDLRKEWQEKLHNLMTGKSRSTETVNVIPKRTEKEELEFNQLREETAELFKAGIRPETWMRERLAELSAKKSYY